MTIGDPRIIGPFHQVQERTLIVLAGSIYVGQHYRTVYELRVVWPVDGTGGETPPETWNLDGSTYIKRTAGPDYGYDALNGTYTAVYQLKGAWGPTP